MYTLKEIRKILNIQEQDPNKDSWSDGDAIEANEGDGKPFTPFELAILKLIHQNLTKGNMEDVLRDHAYPGEVGKKWQNIAKLVGLKHNLNLNHSIEDIVYDKKYVKWALDNWTEDGDYGSIEKPIKVPPKRYKVDREESGTQTVYKDGSTTVIGYDEDSASDSADTEFWDWGGEMETTDYGDYETYDSEITSIKPVEVLSEEKQKEFNGLVKLCQLGEKYTPKIVGGVTRETLTQFLKENINDMVYRDEPKKKHVKRMNSGLGPLTGFPIERFKNMPPPENESIETEEEIDYLGSIPTEKSFIESADDIDQHFKKFLDSKELEFPEKELKGVMDGVKSIILQLKYHYNRPRPYQIAKAKNLELDSEHLKSSKTPSYPSGHATQGTFIGRYLSDLYPEYEKELRQIGEDIAFSRNMAKVHYPSDSEFGKMLGNDLYEFVYQPEEELSEQTESSLEYGGDKLLVPIKSLEQYGNEYLKKDLKKILTNILECLERTCYQIGEPYFLSMVDEDGESVQLQSTCSDCTHLLDETLVTLDAELIKMGFLKGNDVGVLVKPFPKEYNKWVESIMQEINPGFFIDDNDEVSYRELGNAYDAYYDLSEQISPEALQDLYAFHGEEFENEMDEEVKPSTQLSGDQSHLINTLEKLQEKRNIGNKVKDFTNKKKEDFKNFWSKLTQGAKRERKETAEAVRILGRLISNKDSVTKEDIKFLKQQSGDIARIITLVSLGAVSVVIPVGLEKLLNQYGISIMPKKRGKDEDGNGIDDHIDVTQNDNLLNESKQEVSPVLKYGDIITILDIPTPTIELGDVKPRKERQSYAFGEPQLFKPYWVWKPSYGTPKREGTYIIVPLDEVSELQKLGHLKPEDEGLPGHLHRKLKTIRRISGDQWVKTNPTQTLNETKQEFNPELKQGDFVRIYDVDKVSPVISREGYVTQDRYMLYGGDSIPEMFKVYIVMLVTKHKVTQSGTEGEKMYVLLGPDMDTSRPLYLFPSHDTWVKLPEEEGNGEFMKELETRQREVERMGLNESTQTNQPLKRGDEVMIIDLDHSTQGNMTGRLPISIVTPDTFKPYRIFGITYRQRENWEGPNDDTRIYQLEPVDITDEERTQDMISGGGQRRGLHMIPGDTWILQKRPENWYDNLHESKQEEINPRLDIGDKIKVIEIDGEHARMPELFTTVYEVIRKGELVKWNGGGEWYDLLPEGYEVIGKNGESYVRLSDWKSIYKGDVWVKVNPPETLSEQREPTKLNPELKMGDEIMVVDIDSEIESGETSYTTPPTGHKPERYIPYVVVSKGSNGHKSEWPWKYVVVAKKTLDNILKLMDEKPDYKKDWEEQQLDKHAKFLWPWVYQWIKTGKFDRFSEFNIRDTLLEQQFPFNRNNKDMERDHPEGEPDWSIRRGNQHYAMNVENTPNEPVAAFNNYLVKNSPFIIEGFDFYLSAVPGNMPQSAIVDVYVPMMDDSAVADDIWNKDRIYYERTEDWSSDRTKYQGRKEKLHNLDYDQKFAEFTYYEDFQDQHPEYVEYLKQELGDTNLLNEPGAQYEMIWRTKRMNLQNELDAIAKLFGVGKVRINRDPRKPWKRQGDSYDNEKIRPGKSVPREWPRT